MPRQIRHDFTECWYHLMNRGLEKRDIFTASEHKELFLDLIATIADEFGIEIHGYCLMDNHYHLFKSMDRKIVI